MSIQQSSALDFLATMATLIVIVSASKMFWPVIKDHLDREREWDKVDQRRDEDK